MKFQFCLVFENGRFHENQLFCCIRALRQQAGFRLFARSRRPGGVRRWDLERTSALSFCPEHVVEKFHQIHVILPKLLLFCKKNDYLEFCYLSLFKCIFEALRGISGGSFQAEGMCRSSRTNQIWSLQRRELPGTRSILSLENHLWAFFVENTTYVSWQTSEWLRFVQTAEFFCENEKIGNRRAQMSCCVCSKKSQKNRKKIAKKSQKNREKIAKKSDFRKVSLCLILPKWPKMSKNRKSRFPVFWSDTTIRIPRLGLS